MIRTPHSALHITRMTRIGVALPLSSRAADELKPVGREMASFTGDRCSGYHGRRSATLSVVIGSEVEGSAVLRTLPGYIVRPGAAERPALVFLMEDRVVDIRPNFFEDEDAAIDSQVSDPTLICFGERPFLAWVVEIGCAGGSARTNDLTIVDSFMT